MSRQTTSIRRRLLLAVLPVMTVALLAALLVATATARRGLSSLSDTNLTLTAESLADAIGQTVADALADTVTAARLDLAAEAVETGDPKNFDWYADELVLGKRKYSGLAVADNAGKAVAANAIDRTGKPLTQLIRGGVLEAAVVGRLAGAGKDASAAFGPGEASAFAGGRSVGFVAPVFDIVDERIGTVVLGLALDYFAARLAAASVVSSSRVDSLAVIVDGQGSPLVWPEGIAAEGWRTGGESWRAADGSLYRAVSRPVPPPADRFGWSIVALKTDAALAAPVNAITNRILLGTGISLLAALALLMFTTTRIVEPLRRLTRAVTTTERAGGFVALPVETNDETGALTASVNAMMDTIRSYESDLEAKVRARTAELAAAKRELTDIFDNMEQAIFTVNAEGTVNAQYSAASRRIFGHEDIAKRPAHELLQFAAPWNGADERMRLWLASIIGADDLQWTLAAEDPPSRVRYRKQDDETPRNVIDLQYVPIYDAGAVAKVMIIATDVTRVVDLEHELRAQAEENRLTVERVSEIISIDPRLFTTFMNEARALTDDAQTKLDAIGGGDEAALRELFRAMHTLKGNARIFRLTSIQNAAHAVEDELDIMRAGKASQEALPRLRESVATLTKLVTEFERLATRVVGTQGAGDAVGQAVVRVREAHVLALRRAFKDLRERLRATGGEGEALAPLGEAIVALGRVPFGSVIARYQREVLDIAREQQKRVHEVAVIGEAVEVDGRLADKLGIVLMHVLRNAIDHGIEAPDQRAAAGKTAQGTIKVELVVTGDTLRLSVTDDGGGIDYAHVRDLAYERGLLGEDAIADDAALTELLFTPGFSTARVVTAISGRGVGLDVVRTAVRDLRGEVHMTSRRGQGATIEVHLPLRDQEAI
ncbi:MAG: ATP-binding protein [Myxococcota bacterium]